MKISVITVSYNSDKTIRETIESVKDQKFDDIEHLIIDGESNDRTLSIVNEYDSLKVISEKDAGIYDAMNKGILNSNGDIIAILNSDDTFAESDVLDEVHRIFSESDADIVYGDIVFIDGDNRTVRKWIPGQYPKNGFRKGWHPPHPAVFVKKAVYDRYGVFNTSFAYAADFEFLLRTFEKEKLKSVYLSKTLVKMKIGGATTSSFRNFITGNMECMKAFKQNSLPVTILYPIIRLIPKVKQLLHRFK